MSWEWLVHQTLPDGMLVDQEVLMEHEETLSAITAFHDQVDLHAARLYTQHGSRLTCHKGCASCCVDELTVFEVEALRIQSREADFLAQAIPHAKGACAFLDHKGACRIYEHRPYVCRTQGLPLRWLEELEMEWVEYRDICPLNEAGPPLEELDEETCWTLGEVEQHLAAIQQQHNPAMTRVSLRGLFSQADLNPPTS